MITNLNDLVAYTNGLAQKVPKIVDEVAIKSEGISENALVALAQRVALPPMYLRCIHDVGVFGVSLGYFALWPTFNRNGDLVESLLKANSGHASGEMAAREAGLLIVGRQEANLICVGSKDGEQSDVVFLLDVMSSSTVEMINIAQNFEIFLLLAGNLHALSFSQGESPSDAVAEMIQCCTHFNCTDEQSRFWQDAIMELVS
jgi:hypothetical protein